MHTKLLIGAAFAALAVAAPNPQVTQGSDGQPAGASASASPVSQIGDGQPQGQSAAAPVSQISDGQVQASAAPVGQGSDGQPQAAASGSAAAASGPAGAAAPAPTPNNPVSPGNPPMVAPPYSYNQQPTINSAMQSSVIAGADVPASEIPGLYVPAVPRVSSQVTGVTSHGPYNGAPATTTGALSNSPKATVAPSMALPPNPTALRYNPNGTLNDQEPLPYQPAGGLGTNGTEPVYRVQSDFDYQSVLLGLYQEWIELDLFHNILATFSKEQFQAEGLTESDQFLIEFMADQESGHATLLSSLLGGPGGATPQCT
jgi:hypothetical protein